MMSFRINRACRIQSTLVDAIVLWEVSLCASAIKDFALGLCLLWNELIGRADLIDSQNNRAFRILKMSKSNERANVAWDGESANVGLSSTELEALMFFCLRTVRDGIAVVDHVDIDADPAQPGERSGSFAIKFPLAEMPVSDEEARRRLGLG